MDSALATSIFRQLFAHETCSVLRQSRSRSLRQRSAAASVSTSQCNTYTPSTRREYTVKTPPRVKRKASERTKPPTPQTLAGLIDRSGWQKRSKFFQDDITDEFLTFPTVTSDQLRIRRAPPRRVKMLLRDFIEDSLYNPHYGYFPKEAIILSPDQPFEFRSMKNSEEFDDLLAKQYIEFEDRLDAVEENDVRQIWHTPTELFKPHYAEAMARYMATNYKLSLYPYYDLLIYEMGAGNGTFMINTLDYLRDEFPEVYERTKFKIIEISSNLAGLQRNNLTRLAEGKGHINKVEIINQSIFDWEQYVSSPCFFVALEVFDNFAHDAIRYHPKTREPYQTWVVIDRDGELKEYWEPSLDPVALRYLRLRDEAATQPFDIPLTNEPLKAKMARWLPGTNEYLTIPEYIPTRLMQFFDILNNYFPAHRLLSSDFNGFTSEAPGLNAPAIQTRYKRQMVGVTTPLVMHGRFDILFPTNFQLAESVYRALTGKLTQVLSQEEFLRQWAYVDETRTRNGENPLLDYYKNASVLVTL